MRNRVLADNFFRTWCPRSNHLEKVRIPHLLLRSRFNIKYIIYNIIYKLCNSLYNYNIINIYNNNYLHNRVRTCNFKHVTTNFYEGVISIHSEEVEENVDEGFCTKSGKRLLEVKKYKSNTVEYRAKLYEGITVKLYTDWSSPSPAKYLYFDFNHEHTRSIVLEPSIPSGVAHLVGGTAIEAVLDITPLLDLQCKRCIPVEDLDMEEEVLQLITEDFERSLNSIPIGRLITK